MSISKYNVSIMHGTFSIKIEDITAGYESKPILSDVSLDITGGEFVGIVGPNGSGKTTLLRTVAKVLHPTKGKILIDGNDIQTIPAKDFARIVAVVPQDTVPAFDFTALEIVLMGRSPHLGRFQLEGSEDLTIARDAMEQTGTIDLADRQFAELSGGERQRVVVARALAQEPKIILLDEPTSHLDINYQFEILGLIHKLNKEKGITVLTVLHDLNLAAQYCDRLVMVGKGKIDAVGTPSEVITAENVKRVYGAEVWVRRHPTTRRPYVISGIDQPANDDKAGQLRVHLICGGGTGAPVFAKLLKSGFEVTAGVINDGDTDQEAAEALGIQYVSTPHFTPISEGANTDNQKLINSADAVVLSDLPFGSGNLANLDAALKAAKNGKLVVVLRPESVEQRDFTGGAATEMMKALLSSAKSASSLDDLTSILIHV